MKMYQVTGAKFRIEAQTPDEALKVAEAYIHRLNREAMVMPDVVDMGSLQVEEMKVKKYARPTNKRV